jgi:hypothetical protein
MPKKIAKKSIKKTTKKTVRKTAKKAPKKTTKRTKPVLAPQVVAPPVAASPHQTACFPQTAPPPFTPHVAVPQTSEADIIWAEIRNLPIQMFALPNQVVEMHCTPVPIDPSKLYVSIRSAATLPALETTLAGRFTVEMADKWVIVARLPQPLVPAKR